MATHNLPTEEAEAKKDEALFDGEDVGGETQDENSGSDDATDNAGHAGSDDASGSEPDMSNQEPEAPVLEPEPEEVVEPELGNADADANNAPEPDATPAEEPVPLRGGNPNAESDSDDQQSEDDGVADESIKKIKMSIEDKMFELSLTERAWAVEDLVNATYASEDNDYYMCKVFEDHVIMTPWMGTQIYSQKYVVENDVFSLVGEREKVYAEFLTESERDALNMMRSTYADLKKYKEDSEAEKIRVEKENVFNMFEERLSDNAEYIALKENRDQYAATELEEKCAAIVGKQAMQFSSNVDAAPTMSTVGVNFASRGEIKDKRYGNLFD